MIEQLFGSKTRVKLLQLFFTHPNRSFYVREITRRIDEQINSVRRELSNLVSVGVVISESLDNKLYYRANKNFQYFEQFRVIFSQSPVVNDIKAPAVVGSKAQVDPKVEIIEDVEDPLALSFKEIGSVDLVLLTGHFVHDARANVDVLVVGDITGASLDRLMIGVEKQEGVSLRYASMTTEQFKYRNDINDRFISLINHSNPLVLIDNINYKQIDLATETEKPVVELDHK